MKENSRRQENRLTTENFLPSFKFSSKWALPIPRELKIVTVSGKMYRKSESYSYSSNM